VVVITVFQVSALIDHDEAFLRFSRWNFNLRFDPIKLLSHMPFTSTQFTDSCLARPEQSAADADAAADAAMSDEALATSRRSNSNIQSRVQQTGGSNSNQQSGVQQMSRRSNMNMQSGVQQTGNGNMNGQSSIQQYGSRRTNMNAQSGVQQMGGSNSNSQQGVQQSSRRAIDPVPKPCPPLDPTGCYKPDKRRANMNVQSSIQQYGDANGNMQSGVQQKSRRTNMDAASDEVADVSRRAASDETAEIADVPLVAPTIVRRTNMNVQSGVQQQGTNNMNSQLAVQQSELPPSRRANMNVQSGIQQYGNGNSNMQGSIQQYSASQQRRGNFNGQTGIQQMGGSNSNSQQGVQQSSRRSVDPVPTPKCSFLDPTGCYNRPPVDKRAAGQQPEQKGELCSVKT
jgi:hypothetical protein